MGRLSPRLLVVLVLGDVVAAAIIIAGLLFDALPAAIAGAVILSATTSLAFVFGARSASAPQRDGDN